MTIPEFQAWCLTAYVDFAAAIRTATAHLAGVSHTVVDIETALDDFKTQFGQRKEEPEIVPAKPVVYANILEQLSALVTSDRAEDAKDTIERAAAAEAARRGAIPDEWSTMVERRREWRFAIYDERGRELDLQRIPAAAEKPKRPVMARTSHGRFKRSTEPT